jgi:hypothetical protein
LMKAVTKRLMPSVVSIMTMMVMIFKNVPH